MVAAPLRPAMRRVGGGLPRVVKGLRRGLWALLALRVLAALVAALYAARALPRTEGTLRLPGATAQLRIERDEHGIPTLHARSETALHYALGVVHAQDRLWQLETHRRIAAGRLAEVLGPGALETDRFLHALGVRRAAAAQWQQLPAASKVALQALPTASTPCCAAAGRRGRRKC